MELKYAISNNEVIITGLEDKSKSITELAIPSRIYGKSVISIGKYAFANTRLANVVIPDSIKSIGDWAFDTCMNLTSVTIPNSVTTIGECAFGYYQDDNGYEKIKDFTIYGQKGSVAEYYANVNGFAFINNERKELERKAIAELNIEYGRFFNEVRIYGNMPLEKQFIFDTVYRYLHDHINLVSMSVLKDIIEQRRYIITLVSDIRTKDLVCSLLDIIETEVSKTLM